MKRFQTFPGLLSDSWLKLTLICNLSLAPAQTKLWVPRRCSASTIAPLLPWQQRVRLPGLPPPSVSSILSVYFWVTAERLNVYALLAPAAPLKSKLEIRIRTTDSRRPKPGLNFKSVAKSLIHLCRWQWDSVPYCHFLFSLCSKNWDCFAQLSAKHLNEQETLLKGFLFCPILTCSDMPLLAPKQLSPTLKASMNALEKSC